MGQSAGLPAHQGGSARAHAAGRHTGGVGGRSEGVVSGSGSSTAGLTKGVFGGGGEFGGGGGGVFGFDDYAGHLQLGGDEEGVLQVLGEFAGGKTLHHSQQWVVRAMRALELRYQAAAKAEALQRFNLEVHAHELAHDLNSHSVALEEAHSERVQAVGDAERAREALAKELATSAALREHSSALEREREMLMGDLQKANGEIRTMQREAQLLHGRWEQVPMHARIHMLHITRWEQARTIYMLACVRACVRASHMHPYMACIHTWSMGAGGARGDGVVEAGG